MFRLQDAALLVAMAWTPIARASTEAGALPSPELALDLASAPGLARIAVNLAIVLAAIVALAFIVRRTGAARGEGSDMLRVQASLALGPKERLLIVEASGERVLVGAGANGMTALHVLPGSAPEESSTAPASYKKVFSLHREAAS